jgi:hypothetical protein
MAVDKFRRHDHRDMAFERVGSRIGKKLLACVVNDEITRFLINDNASIAGGVEHACRPGL